MRQPRQVSQVSRSTRTLVCVQCEHDECYRGSTGGDCSEDRLLEIAHALSDLSHNRRSPAHRLNVSPAHAQRGFITLRVRVLWILIVGRVVQMSGRVFAICGESEREFARTTSSRTFKHTRDTIASHHRNLERDDFCQIRLAGQFWYIDKSPPCPAQTTRN